MFDNKSKISQKSREPSAVELKEWVKRTIIPKQRSLKTELVQNNTL